MLAILKRLSSVHHHCHLQYITMGFVHLMCDAVFAVCSNSCQFIALWIAFTPVTYHQDFLHIPIIIKSTERQLYEAISDTILVYLTII